MNNPRARGYTLIELLVVLAIIALLATIALPRYFGSIDTAKEAVLLDNLRLTRQTIDRYYSDVGHYPDSLQELVDRKYLSTLPMDPITKSTSTWVIIAPSDGSEGAVADLHSGAPGARKDGTPFSEL